jgi:hypothetical protein
VSTTAAIQLILLAIICFLLRLRYEEAGSRPPLSLGVRHWLHGEAHHNRL